ncbi:MAG: response regulator transcription factor [Deltaproteobacteria bacterium]|nr:response regulator transcription factor [Deltaproteobacteria bacterium]
MGQEDDDKRVTVSWFPNSELEADLENIPLRILIAEDDDASRGLLKRSLASKGYSVIAAENGEKAWEIIQDERDPPELAILDWMMPGVDGIELCRRIKKRGNPFVYTILLTAKSENADIIAGLEAGAHEFLTKPFDIHVLWARVAAGGRIVRLEKALTIKSSILEDYADKLERQTRDLVKKS